MLPTPKSAHRDSHLTNISIGYRDQAFIGDRVFQNVPVNKQSDYFFKFLKGAWFRLDSRKRGPGSKAWEGGYPITDDTYKCTEEALKHPVPIELMRNADLPFKPLESGAKYVTTQILLAKEKAISDMVVTAANWTSTNDADAGWAAAAGSNTFIDDVNEAKDVVRKLIGRFPNVMLMDAGTFKKLKTIADILDRIKYTGTQGKPADVTAQVLAQLFELDEVMIGTAIYSDAEEVVAGTDFNAVDLWETNATKGSCFLFYRPPAPGVEVPAAGYVFNWKGDEGQQTPIMQSDVYRSVRKWWDDERKSWMVEGSEYYDPKVTCADAGYLFTDTIVT